MARTRWLDETASDGDIDALRKLLAVLLQSVPNVPFDSMRRRLADPRVSVVVVEEVGQLVATASLVSAFTVAKGSLGLVEEVVADPEHRGAGFGRKAVEAVHAKARELGLTYLDLTAHVGREAANGLYQRLGYSRRETNVYRLTL